MKELGGMPEDDDDDMKEINKEMKRWGKNISIYIVIEKLGQDGDDINEDDLLNELGGMVHLISHNS
jgi:hypothetical protein